MSYPSCCHSSTLKRNSTDNRPSANTRLSKPIPIPSPSKHSAAYLPTDSEGSSSSHSDSPYTPPQQDSPPNAANVATENIPPEWIYPLPLTLEELFKGGKYTYQISTRMISGAPRIQTVELDVKPGWKSGTRVIFPSAGNERKPGVFQDIIFVVEQIHHERFARLEGGRIVLNEDVDYHDANRAGVRREPRRVVGLDGTVLEIHPPAGIIKQGMETVVKNHGMWQRSKSKVVGRGDLVIR